MATRMGAFDVWNVAWPSGKAYPCRRRLSGHICTVNTLDRPVNVSNVAHYHRLLERYERAAPRDEFVRAVAGESGVVDILRDPVVVKLLRFVDRMTAGNATRMEVGEVLDVVLNRLYDIALHDLHMVYVV